MMEVMLESAETAGLKMNSKKSYCMIFGKMVKPDIINGLRVVSELKYLGIWVNDSGDCYKEHKKIKLNLARKMSNITFSVVSRCCNRVIVGSTYWKSVVLPTLLNGAAVVTYTVSELEQLQRVENCVWRYILGAPRCAPVVTLRGEIGASSMEARDMKTKLTYACHLLTTGNEMLKQVARVAFEEKFKFVEKTLSYAKCVDLQSVFQLAECTKREIKERTKLWDTERWRKDKAERSSIEVYDRFKDNIRQEDFYHNDKVSRLVYRLRSNTAKLNWRNRFVGGSELCALCEEEEVETLEHFLVKCSAYNLIREKHDARGAPLSDLLLFTSEVVNRESVLQFLGEAWSFREDYMSRL